MPNKFLQLYLKFWAKQYLSRTKPKIIAITGSVGKTSAKEAIFSVLKNKFKDKIRKSEGNLNTETGVPLAILAFDKSPQKFYHWLPVLIEVPFRSYSLPGLEVLVLEYAADKPGDISYLTGIAKPDVALITEIAPSHLSAFGSIEKIAEEKTSLLWGLPQNGWAVLNADNEFLRKASYSGKWQKLLYGVKHPADVTAKNIDTQIVNGLPKTTFDLEKKDEKIKIITKTLGNYANVQAALAGAAIGKIFGLSLIEIKKGLEEITSVKHRMQIFAGKQNTTIIDDCYNANPASMRAALETLKTLTAKRKIAVLGDMREIGKISSDAHHEIGKLAREVVNIIVSIGESARGYDANKHFKDRKQAIQYLEKEIEEGDLILVKASRAIGLEEIVDRLKA